MAQRICVVDYGMGNLRSVENALRFLGCRTRLAASPEGLKGADAYVLPGVGAFGEAMENLARRGLRGPLSGLVIKEKVPILGICLGMQLVAESSDENGNHKGLGWVQGHVRKIPVGKTTRLPHIGWNNVEISKTDPLYQKVKGDLNFYFVHSYRFECDDEYVSATCEYDVPITASIQKGHIFATQFHPEKSQENGLRVLRSFVDYVQNSRH